jgi:hypothetical protein
MESGNASCGLDIAAAGTAALHRCHFDLSVIRVISC